MVTPVCLAYRTILIVGSVTSQPEKQTTFIIARICKKIYQPSSRGGKQQGACIGVVGEINRPCVPCESGCAQKEFRATAWFKITNFIKFHVYLTIPYYKNIYSGAGSGIPLYLGFFETGLSDKVVD